MAIEDFTAPVRTVAHPKMRPMTAMERAQAYPVETTQSRRRKRTRSNDLTFAHTLPAHEQAVIDAALTILTKYLSEGSVLDALDAPERAKTYCRMKLGLEHREVFAVMFLDAQHSMIAFEELFAGTLTQTSVYPREVVLRALAHNAAAVILVHNHPGGNVIPSAADESLTRTLRGTLKLVDIHVLDHIIVGGGESLSMAEKGLL